MKKLDSLTVDVDAAHEDKATLITRLILEIIAGEGEICHANLGALRESLFTATYMIPRLLLEFEVCSPAQLRLSRFPE